MINDYPEVMCHIKNDMNELQKLLDAKKYDQAREMTLSVMQDLSELVYWIEGKNETIHCPD